MFKNTASQKLTVLAFADAGHATLDAGEKVTGDSANITLKVEQDDDGVRSASNDTNPTETEDGQYVFDLTQAETNGDKLTFYPESSTAGVQVVALPSSVIYTRPPSFADGALATAANLATVDTVADGIKAVTDLLPDSGALTSLATASALATVDSNVDAILVDTGTTLENHLTDIKGTGFVKDTHSLTDIEAYVDLIDDGTSGLAKIATDAAAILVDTAEIGAAGAGLTSVAQASVCTEARLAELDAANLPADVDVLAAGISAETQNNTLLEQLKLIRAIVEHQRGGHTHQPIGNVFFVDPVNGDTHANGNRGGIDDPYLGVQDCHDNAVTDSNHDMMILLSGAAAGATTLTEPVTISKRYLFIRGPGRDFIWTRGDAGDTITVTADGVELSGFQVNTAGTGAGNGITVSGADFFRAYRLWVNDTQGHGVELTDCENAQIVASHFHNSGQSGAGHGLVMNAGNGQSGNGIVVEECHFHGVAGDGIRLDTTGTGTVNTAVIAFNHFLGSSGWGVNLVDSGVTSASVYKNTFGNNTSGSINDAGTTTVAENNEQWATATALATVDTVADGIKAVTDLLPDGGALTSLATVASITALNDLSQADVRTATGLASANLDTQLAALQTDLDTITDTGVTCVALTSAAITDVWATDTLTEAYAADGAAGTAAELLYMIYSVVAQADITSTTLTSRKLDGTTAAMTFTLDDATTPSSRVRAS